MSNVPERPLDLNELFRALDEHGVDYLVIGGVAAQVHGRRRTTKDLDVLPAPDQENARRLATALQALDVYPVKLGPGASTPTAEQMHLAPIVRPLTTRHGELHIVNEPTGALAYEDMRTRALSIDLDGITIQIVSVDDLIRMKKAAGRPGDLDDIDAIAEVARGAARSASAAQDVVKTEPAEQDI